MDIIHHILTYSDAIKLRHGRYMNCIARDDPRYTVVSRIQRETHCVMPQYAYCIHVNPTLQICFLEDGSQFVYTFNGRTGWVHRAR